MGCSDTAGPRPGSVRGSRGGNPTWHTLRPPSTLVGCHSESQGKESLDDTRVDWQRSIGLRRPRRGSAEGTRSRANRPSLLPSRVLLPRSKRQTPSTRHTVRPPRFKLFKRGGHHRHMYVRTYTSRDFLALGPIFRL